RSAEPPFYIPRSRRDFLPGYTLHSSPFLRFPVQGLSVFRGPLAGRLADLPPPAEESGVFPAGEAPAAPPPPCAIFRPGHSAAAPLRRGSIRGTGWGGDRCSPSSLDRLFPLLGVQPALLPFPACANKVSDTRSDSGVRFAWESGVKGGVRRFRSRHRTAQGREPPSRSLPEEAAASGPFSIRAARESSWPECRAFGGRDGSALLRARSPGRRPTLPPPGAPGRRRRSRRAPAAQPSWSPPALPAPRRRSRRPPMLSSASPPPQAAAVAVRRRRRSSARRCAVVVRPAARMDPSGVVQEALAGGQTCLAAVQGSLVVEPASRESRLLGLVESGGRCLICLYSHRRMAVAAEDLRLERALRLEEGFALEEVLMETELPTLGSDVTIRIVSPEANLLVRLPFGSQTQVFLREVRKHCVAGIAGKEDLPPEGETWPGRAPRPMVQAQMQAGGVCERER
uniref:INPP5B PH domain-containing protein n=1 Tax=Laticauda laticaudata TaxID=8630 RepID=A0A8C5S409_LATLA